MPSQYHPHKLSLDVDSDTYNKLMRLVKYRRENRSRILREILVPAINRQYNKFEIAEIDARSDDD